MNNEKETKVMNNEVTIGGGAAVAGVDDILTTDVEEVMPGVYRPVDYHGDGVQDGFEEVMPGVYRPVDYHGDGVQDGFEEVMPGVFVPMNDLGRRQSEAVTPIELEEVCPGVFVDPNDHSHQMSEGCANPNICTNEYHHMPVIPKSGSMTFTNNNVDDALATVKALLSNVECNLTVYWECR